MMRCAAKAMVCKPEEQKRLTVMPEVVMGKPARKATWRAIFAPVAPSGVAQPMMTSSTSAPSMPARLTACSTACPPNVAPCVILKEPFQLLARGVRAVETITADVMIFPYSVTYNLLTASLVKYLVKCFTFSNQLSQKRCWLPKSSII